MVTCFKCTRPLPEETGMPPVIHLGNEKWAHVGICPTIPTAQKFKIVARSEKWPDEDR